MPLHTCGTMLAHLLEAYGTQHVFGIPGVHNVEVYRGLWQTKIRHVSPRHEQGAGFMADGFARATGKPGVAFVITGPGLTNIATAMGQAYGDSVPMLVISTVNRRHELAFGRGFLHEMPNQRNLAAGLTAFSHTLQRAEELPDVLAAAYAVFSSSRPRPVNIEIPIDVIEQKLEWDPSTAQPVRISAPGPAEASLAAAVVQLASAKRIAIIAGGGAAGAADQIRQLAELLQAPVQLTTNGRGILPVEHPLLGGWGVGFDAGRTLLNTADCVLAIGTEMGETDYDFYATSRFAPSAPLIRIDIDPRQIAIGPRAQINIVADAGLAVTALYERLAASQRSHTDPDWTAATVRGFTEVSLRSREPEDPIYDRLLLTVREALGDPILVADSTKPAYRGQNTYRAPAPRSFFAAGTGFGTLGYALPAAIGAKIACPERPVVALSGDGGLQFTLPELISAREAEAGIVLLIWNNQGYREIRDYMVAKEIPPIAVDPIPPDFQKVADAMGVAAKRAGSFDELASILKRHPASAKAPLVVETGPWLERG
jgi:acetolactate synthase I/II/III large subunit